VKAVLSRINVVRCCLGLANIAAVCQKSRRVSINHEFGEYASIQTGAHELGHKYVD